MNLSNYSPEQQEAALSRGIHNAATGHQANRSATEQALLRMAAASVVYRIDHNDEQLPAPDFGHASDLLEDARKRLGLSPLQFCWTVLAYLGASLKAYPNGGGDEVWALEMEAAGEVRQCSGGRWAAGPQGGEGDVSP